MEDLADMNCSNISLSDESCFAFSEHGFKAIVWIRSGLSILGILLCIVVIFIILFFRAYKHFVNRLTLYLCSAALFSAIIFAIQRIPVDVKCGRVVVTNHKLCIAAAFLIEYSVWLILLLTIWIGFHLLLQVVCHYEKTLRYEIIGLITVITVPVVFCIIPLICNTYGLAGAWCWIKTTDNKCNEIKAGIIQQFVLWYGQVMLFVAVNFITVLYIVIKLCIKKQGAADEPPTMQEQYNRSIAEFRPLIAYPIIFSIIYSLGFANRVYYAATHNANLSLWILHAIVDPLLSLIIPLAFLLHPNIRKIINCNQFRRAADNWQDEPNTTYYPVPKEDDDDDNQMLAYGRATPTSQISGLTIPTD